MKRLDPARLRALVRRIPWLEVAVLAIAFAVLLAIGVFNARGGEDAVQQLDSFSTYDAKSGGYRAWFDLLVREGLAVEQFEFRPAFLDRSFATLVWAEPLAFDPRQSQSTENDIHQLEAWVRAGGRLVYVGSDNVAARQKLLALPFAFKAKRASGGVSAAPELAAFGVRDVRADGSLRYVAPKGATTLVRDRWGAVVVRYPYGRGSVTAVIDESLFTNARLGTADHARLAYALVAASANGAGTPAGRIGFDEAVHGFEEALNWWDLVPRAFVIAVIVGVLALAIAILGGAIRLGPPIVPVARADRGSGDFLDSIAGLFIRGNAVRKALLDAWLSTKRIVATHVGVPDDASVQDIAARVEGSEARAAFVSLERIATNAFPDDTNLVRGLALAQRLRKDYTTHGRTGR